MSEPKALHAYVCSACHCTHMRDSHKKWIKSWCNREQRYARLVRWDGPPAARAGKENKS